MAAEEQGDKIVEALNELSVHNFITLPKIGPFDFSISNTVVYM